MADEPSADLGLIGRQQRQLLDQMRTMADDLTVMSAVLMRVDGTLTGLVQEVRAIHAQHSRLANRVRAMEGQS